jgi:hypothetical protein
MSKGHEQGNWQVITLQVDVLLTISVAYMVGEGRGPAVEVQCSASMVTFHPLCMPAEMSPRALRCSRCTGRCCNLHGVTFRA